MSKVLELTTEKHGVAHEIYPDSTVTLHNPLRSTSNKIPYKTGEFDGIYASYMLNKLGWRQAVPSVLDWSRCLREGGLLHIIVPSRRWIGRALQQEEVPPHVKVLLFGTQTSTYEYHKSIWSLEDLRMIFEFVGMATIKARSNIVQVEVAGETYDGEQLYAVGLKDKFVTQRLKGKVHEPSTTETP